MFAQYQKRKEYFKQYREKNKERLQQTKETRLLMKRIKIGKTNMQSNGNKTIPQWYGCKNKNTLKRTKIKSMNTDAVSMLKIKKPKIPQSGSARYV